MNEMAKGIDYLLELNKEQSNSYMDVAMERRRYRGEHPTEIAALLCMDGRLSMPLVTQTAPGVIQTFRNLGGKFDLGWSYFQTMVDQWVQYSIGRGRHCLIFVTYHYARGDTHRGCKGFNYDTDAARNATMKLKSQFDQVYGKGAVHPIVCGIETDLDALILHGEDGRPIDLADIRGEQSRIELEALIRSLYPSMPMNVVSDLMPLVRGNIRHISGHRTSNRAVADTEHNEWVVAVGKGFDWLYTHNTAFIVGPFDPNLAVAIETAARLLKINIDEGRTDPNGVVLLSSDVFRDAVGPEYHLAKEKSLFLAKFATDIINEKIPDLAPKLQILSGITDANTKKFEVIERLDKVAA
jgi:hypothetical protein